ncbi:hypothetical protein F4860DRAFT_526810 [Xylaria cubensis]|nr:hypothetical protein F4860DRAFT_526810 [Xylaria cubensis]
MRYPKLTDATFQHANPNWFMYIIPYQLAKELDIENLDLVERQPFRANHETYVNWPAITAIAKADLDCITPIAIYCAVLTPERVRSTTYKDVVSSEANVSPWEMSVAELQGFPTPLGNVAHLLNALDTVTGVKIIANDAEATADSSQLPIIQSPPFSNRQSRQAVSYTPNKLKRLNSKEFDAQLKAWAASNIQMAGGLDVPKLSGDEHSLSTTI